MDDVRWKQRLAGAASAELEAEIDVFETQLRLRKDGKIEDKLFAETRLRRGAYGQRYDNGRRYDGEKDQTIAFPCGDLTKGPETVWDAPGMVRIKIPFGALTATQLEVMADLAEEYSDDILHVTTRQDIQLHFIHIDDTPDLFRRLAAVGITTREACGNSVRNVTGCPVAGVCKTEAFDISPYAKALAHYLLGHPDTQDFGRKFKIAFSGCATEACGLALMHDIGLVAVTRPGDAGATERGFEFYVGGGLGAVPHQALLLDGFVPEAELMPLTQAVCRIFARHGEKQNRARARLKFLVKKLGLPAFKQMVDEERAKIPPEARWSAWIDSVAAHDQPKRPPAPALRKAGDAALDAWWQTNVRPQRQPGYAVVSVTLPLGDFTPDQARGLADLAREYTGDTIRLTVEQNLVLRWVPEADVPQVYARLAALGLAEPGAESIVDVTACPGTDTCKLGISASRGLAGELRTRLAARSAGHDEALGSLRIKVSGCFNSCGQHHVADLGFLGVQRNVEGRRVPHFQVVLGGQWTHNAGQFGLAIGAVPSKRIPEVVDRITSLFARERSSGERFGAFIKRVGKSKIRDMLTDLMDVPPYEQARELYHDWADPREYGIGDIGVGECAGEIVSVAKFGLADGERVVFEASEALERGDAVAAAKGALAAMLLAAKALVRQQTFDIGDDPARIVEEFRARFYDTKLFFDTYAGGKFAHYFFALAARDLQAATLDDAHHYVEEAQLFIEAAYACETRMAQAGATAPA
ncbi:MAG: nitrite/sulfite reductase [Nannocystaceae bacterium]|nr:nitrite/sulfite reductase [Nannocystaceae bacterium]